MKVSRELTIEDLDNLKDGDKVYIEDVVNENIDKDGVFNVLFKNCSNIQNIPDNCSIRGKRSSIMWVAYEDKKYNKYLKRVKNRQKLYDKLRKIGR